MGYSCSGFDLIKDGQKIGDGHETRHYLPSNHFGSSSAGTEINHVINGQLFDGECPYQRAWND